MDLLQVIRGVGLSLKEAKIYLHLLKSGPQRASHIARYLNIPRSNIYYHIDSLRELGLVSEHHDFDATTYFKAAPPKVLLKILNERKDELNERLSKLEFIMPELEALQSGAISKYPQLRFCDKYNQVEELYQEIVRSGKILAIVNIEKVNDFFPQYGMKFPELVKKAGIEARELLTPNDTAKEYIKKVTSCKNPKHEVRLLDKSFMHKTDILIYKDGVAFVSYRQKPIAFVVEDELILHAHKEIFEKLWSLTAPPKK